MELVCHEHDLLSIPNCRFYRARSPLYWLVLDMLETARLFLQRFTARLPLAMLVPMPLLPQRLHRAPSPKPAGAKSRQASSGRAGQRQPDASPTIFAVALNASETPVAVRIREVTVWGDGDSEPTYRP